MSNVADAAFKVAERYSTLSNPYRALILTYLIKKKESSWSQIKQLLEKHMGVVNPNTLQFHLRILMKLGIIGRSGSENNLLYHLDSLPKDIESTLSEEITEKLKDDV
jgi:DNA-binding HxlR family transcriptional regulator